MSLSFKTSTGVMLLACLLSACGAKSKASGPAPTPVQVAQVMSPSGQTAVEATGTLRRTRESALSFRTPGVITKLLVDEGDTVRAGQVLAVIDPTALDARLKAAAADLERARRDVDRFGPLVEKGAISREQFDNQKTALYGAEAAYASAAFDRRWANLRAPSSGVILLRSAQSGEVVAAGQPVLSLADTSSPLVIRFPLSDRDVARVRLGQVAQVRLDALNGQMLAGQVSRISQRARPETGQIEVEVTLAAIQGLRSGMVGTVQMPSAASARPSSTFQKIPAEAVLEATGGRAFVLKLDGKLHARRTAVGFGGFDGDDALVSGLAPGDRVITAGAGYVSDGEAVSVVDPASLSAARSGPRDGAGK